MFFYKIQSYKLYITIFNTGGDNTFYNAHQKHHAYRFQFAEKKVCKNMSFRRQEKRYL